MINQTKTVSLVVQMFKAELLPLYPIREIEQFIVLSFEDVMHFSKMDVHLKAEAQVADSQFYLFEAILEGLKNHEPIQYLIGHTVFYGLPITVNPSVLIPRPETEELVHWIIKEGIAEPSRIIDICTGSGCIALALKDRYENAIVYGVDNSVDALNVAMENSKKNNLDISFFQFDVLKQQSLGFMNFDVMVSNPPYVTHFEKSMMEPNVLNNEPHSALFVPDDEPLLFYRKIVDLADGHLSKHGHLYLEANSQYARDVAQLFQDRGYGDVDVKKDFTGRDRMVKAKKV